MEFLSEILFTPAMGSEWKPSLPHLPNSYTRQWKKTGRGSLPWSSKGWLGWNVISYPSPKPRVVTVKGLPGKAKSEGECHTP